MQGNWRRQIPIGSTGHGTSLDIADIRVPASAMETRGITQFFGVDVSPKGGGSSWRVMRSYSEFRELYEGLKSGAHAFTDVPFPPKRPLLRFGVRRGQLQARRRDLEAWLRQLVLEVMLGAVDLHFWPWCGPLQSFLGAHDAHNIADNAAYEAMTCSAREPATVSPVFRDVASAVSQCTPLRNSEVDRADEFAPLFSPAEIHEAAALSLGRPAAARSASGETIRIDCEVPGVAVGSTRVRDADSQVSIATATRVDEPAASECTDQLSPAATEEETLERTIIGQSDQSCWASCVEHNTKCNESWDADSGSPEGQLRYHRYERVVYNDAGAPAFVQRGSARANSLFDEAGNAALEERLGDRGEDSAVGVWHDGEQHFEIKHHDGGLFFLSTLPDGEVLRGELIPDGDWLLVTLTSADGEVAGTARLRFRCGWIVSQAQEADGSWGEEVITVSTATQRAFLEWEKKCAIEDTGVGDFDVRVRGLCWGDANTTLAFNVVDLDYVVGEGFHCDGPFVIRGRARHDSALELVLTQEAGNRSMRLSWDGPVLRGHAQDNGGEITFTALSPDAHAQLFKDFQALEKQRGYAHCTSCGIEWQCALPRGSQCAICNGQVEIGPLQIFEQLHRVGESVEVYSAFVGKWCQGHLEKISCDGVLATYTRGTDQACTKFLTWTSPEIRFLRKEVFHTHGDKEA